MILHNLILQEHSSQAASFLQLAESLAGTQRGAAFHALAKERCIPASLATYLLTRFLRPVVEEQPGEASAADSSAGSGNIATGGLVKQVSKEWGDALALPGSAIAIQLLVPFVKGHPVRPPPTLPPFSKQPP